MTDTRESGQKNQPSGAQAGPRPNARSDALRNRARLLAAAESVFASAGPEASLNQIARQAGVGAGTLYRHFPTREALLAAVLTERIERLTQRADALLAEPDPDRALADWLHAFLDHAQAQQGLGSALLLTKSELGFDCHQRLREAAGELLARAQGRGTTRPDLTTEEMLRLVVGIALATSGGVTDEDGGEAARPERLLALVLDALRRRPSKARR
ncbi:TetR family transcriptional regulator [Streptomyces sp. 3MP-14]|uniref:TetR family transcriptional regulator n=1 Tax=Streptomyces mimosae TaxID=2586635 RepID=A0A5N6AKM7_9ACTN|nr:MULTISPECIES: TetR/AcrR family transcriptional regulator [Streptomyces]KAB8168596.1 TetR family transcriptional regulator [Streptomyces mimosae]KAB8178124.1 TetR family transcriptional regulator [Streptomyces sp. 3MP-14]